MSKTPLKIVMVAGAGVGGGGLSGGWRVNQVV